MHETFLGFTMEDPSSINSSSISIRLIQVEGSDEHGLVAELTRCGLGLNTRF